MRARSGGGSAELRGCARFRMLRAHRLLEMLRGPLCRAARFGGLALSAQHTRESQVGAAGVTRVVPRLGSRLEQRERLAGVGVRGRKLPRIQLDAGAVRQQNWQEMW